MVKQPSDPDEEKRQELRQAGVYVTIPFALGIPPILGWLIGEWLDRLMGTSPVFMYLLIALGFAAGFREVYRIIKRFGNGT
jgi:ATP synthase protein I